MRLASARYLKRQLFHFVQRSEVQLHFKVSGFTPFVVLHERRHWSDKQDSYSTQALEIHKKPY